MGLVYYTRRDFDSLVDQMHVLTEKEFDSENKAFENGALLSDIIRIGNHVITSRMSNAEFNTKCKTLRTKFRSSKQLKKGL